MRFGLRAAFARGSTGCAKMLSGGHGYGKAVRCSSLESVILDASQGGKGWDDSLGLEM